MEKLGLNVSELIWQIVAFGLLIFLLQRFLYRPVLRMLDERRSRIDQSMRDAQTAAEKASAAQAEFERRITESKKEAQAILAQANDTSAKLKEELLIEAREQARQLVEKAKEEIEAERARTMGQLEKQVADLAITVSQRVIGESLSEETQRRLIGDFLNRTGDLK
jgi:F-type H+-transporting ATPase subunit b